MALQLTAVETSDGLGLIFTRVLDTVELGLMDEDEQVSETTDRAYWEKKKASPATFAIADQIFEMCRSFAPALKQSYLKNYIGFRLENQAFNFAVCKPGPKNLRLEIKLPKTDEIDAELERTDLEVLAYRRHFGLYAINLKPADIEANREYLFTLLKRAYDNRI